MIKINKRYYIQDGNLYHNCTFWRSFLGKLSGYPRGPSVFVRVWVNAYYKEIKCWKCNKSLPSLIYDKAKFIDSELKYDF